MTDVTPTPRRPSIEQLANELKRVVQKGLPVGHRQAGDVLPNLRGVVARSVHPADVLSRNDALNQLLPRLIGQIDDNRLGPAARILFGIEPGTAGTTLTRRRARAASYLDYDPDHFRKHIEPKVRYKVAERLHRDTLKYRSRAKRATAALEPTGDTPSLTEADLTAEEELISRIWQHVYGLRAELIAAGRLASQPAYADVAEEHRQAGRHEHAELKKLIDTYIATYGNDLIRHGEVEYAAEALVRLGSWTIEI